MTETAVCDRIIEGSEISHHNLHKRLPTMVKGIYSLKAPHSCIATFFIKKKLFYSDAIFSSLSTRRRIFCVAMASFYHCKAFIIIFKF